MRLDSTLETFRLLLADSPSHPVGYAGLIPAAVLALIFRRDDEYFIVLNKRTDRVEYHKGEICFPGGGQDPGDLSPWATALRETWEEMGIDDGQVDPLGALDPVVTRTKFVIYPFVGTISYPYSSSINRDEVAEVFEAPILDLLNPNNNWEEIVYDFEGYRTNLAYSVDGHRIVGATARILNQILAVFKKALAQEV